MWVNIEVGWSCVIRVSHLHSLMKKTQLLIETFNLLTDSKEAAEMWFSKSKKNPEVKQACCALRVRRSSVKIPVSVFHSVWVWPPAEAPPVSESVTKTWNLNECLECRNKKQRADQVTNGLIYSNKKTSVSLCLLLSLKSRQKPSCILVLF